MKSKHPPRLALVLLERFVPDSAPLAGDLVEEFGRRQSICWMWWQVLTAIATTRFDRSEEIRPLQLVELQPADAAERSRRKALDFRPVNLSGSPVSGVGGLGLLALVGLVTTVMPAAWWAWLASALAGACLAVVIVHVHRTEQRPITAIGAVR